MKATGLADDTVLQVYSVQFRGRDVRKIEGE